MTPELSRPFAIDRLARGLRIDVTANAEECAAVARRLGLPAIAELRCSFECHPAAGSTIAAHGRLQARIIYTCGVSFEPYAAELAEDFAVRFVPEGEESDELDLDADDEIPYAGDTIDLGEATAEQLALALDPFPRKPDAALPADISGPTGPFAGLAKLRGDEP